MLPPSGPAGPVGIVILGTSPTLSRGGIASVLPGYFDLLKSAGIPFRFIPTHSNDRLSGKFRHWVLAPKRLGSAIREFQNQGLLPVIHAHAGQWPSLVRKATLLRYAHGFGARTFLQIHGAEIDGYLAHAPKRAALRVLLKPACHLLVLTPYWAERLKTLGLKQPISVLPNPLHEALERAARSATHTRQALRAAESSKKILVLNRLIPGKGLELALEAFSKLPPQYRLVVAGEGPLRPTLELQARTLGVSDRVHFPGWVSGTDKDRLFESSTLFCLPTQRDCMSTGMLEAMAHGVPVVGLRYGPTLDLVPDGQAGVLAHEPTAESVAKAMLSILETPGRSEALGNQAQAWVLDQYSREAVTRAWLKILETLPLQPQKTPYAQP